MWLDGIGLRAQHGQAVATAHDSRPLSRQASRRDGMLQRSALKPWRQRDSHLAVSTTANPLAASGNGLPKLAMRDRILARARKSPPSSPAGGGSSRRATAPGCSAWRCLTDLPDAWITMHSADFSDAIRPPCGGLSRDRFNPGAPETSIRISVHQAATVAPRFFQTPPRGDALAVRAHFTSIRLCRGLAPLGCQTCSAHATFTRSLRDQRHKQASTAFRCVPQAAGFSLR